LAHAGAVNIGFIAEDYRGAYGAYGIKPLVFVASDGADYFDYVVVRHLIFQKIKRENGAVLRVVFLRYGVSDIVEISGYFSVFDFRGRISERLQHIASHRGRNRGVPKTVILESDCAEVVVGGFKINGYLFVVFYVVEIHRVKIPDLRNKIFLRKAGRANRLNATCASYRGQ